MDGMMFMASRFQVARCSGRSIVKSRGFCTPASSPAPRVALIGLGNMGLPMALNLRKVFPRVLVYDVAASARERAAASGLSVAASSADVAAAGCDVCVTMLPGDAAVHDTMRHLLEASSDKAQTIVDCSTVSPATSRHWQAEWAALDTGSMFLDAPVSGGVKGATDGTLTFMVGYQGGEVPDTVQTCLQVMGKRVVVCGGPGTGAATKLCNNLALAAQMVGICEAMSLGEALHVDPVVLADVMGSSTAKCWSLDVCNPHPLVATSRSVSGTGSPAAHDYQGGFSTRLMLKDLSLAVAAAEAAGVAVPIGAASKELYQIATARGLGDKDFGVMFQFLRGQK